MEYDKNSFMIQSFPSITDNTEVTVANYEETWNDSQVTVLSAAKQSNTFLNTADKISPSVSSLATSLGKDVINCISLQQTL